MIYTLRVGRKTYYVDYKEDIYNFKEYLESRQPNEYIKAIRDMDVREKALVKASEIDSVVLEDAFQELTNDN